MNEFNTYHFDKTEEEWRDGYANAEQYYSDYVSLFVQTLGEAARREAPLTPFLSSTPTNGDDSASHGGVAEQPNGELHGTMHFYDRKNNMWMAANQPVPRFMDEYGFQSFPSVATLRKYAVEEDLYWTSRFVKHRQHGTNANDDLVRVLSTHFDVDALTHSRDADGLARLFYLAQVNQAQSLRIATEHLRRSQAFTTDDYRGLTMGALYWQLNSVWPGADLSPLEFGGKWKLAAHQVEPMFRPLMISAAEMNEGSVDIFIVNDHEAKVTGLRVRLLVQKYSEAKVCSNGTFESAVTAEPTSTTAFMSLPVKQILDRCKFREFEYLEDMLIQREAVSNETASMTSGVEAPGQEDVSMPVNGEWRRYAAFLVLQLLDSAGAVVSENHLLLSEPKHAVGLSDPEIRAAVARLSPSSFELRFRSKRAALFVYLECELGGRAASFSDNGFLLWGGARAVIMNATAAATEEEVKQALVVMSYYPQHQEFPGAVP